jgi:hypothetical protein
VTSVVRRGLRPAHPVFWRTFPGARRLLPRASGWGPGRTKPDSSLLRGSERGRPPRRVREEVRDGVTVAVFSAAASTLLWVAMVALTMLVG